MIEQPLDDQRRKLGGRLFLFWLGGGIVMIGLSLIFQVGPYAWAVAAQERDTGSYSMMLGCIPLIAIWIVPMVIVGSRRWSSPVLAGAADAMQRPLTDVGHEADPRQVLKNRSNACLAAAAAVLTLAACWTGYVRRAAPPAGRPLPVRDYAAAIDPTVELPRYLRLSGAVVQPQPQWRESYTVRQDRHIRTYRAIVPTLSTSGTIRLLMTEDIDIGIGRPTEAGSALEGEVSPHPLPSWRIAALQRAGLNVVPGTRVIARRGLGGKIPDDRWLNDFTAGALAVPTAIVFALMAWSFRRVGATYPEAS